MSKSSKLLSKKTNSRKVIVVMPAYNAEKTLVDSYNKLPKESIDEIILVDDDSKDGTAEIASSLPIIYFKNPFNLGYGGNLKVCLSKAIERGADVIIEYHPDNQYDPKNLPIFIKKAKQGYDFALGSRFIHPRQALVNKMPLVKFIANRAMSFIDQFVLGIELSEFHSGFRMYSKKMLSKIPYLQNSDDYLFSFEVIVQAVYHNLKIAEVPIACKYHPLMHTANMKRSTIYALSTFKTLYQYVLSKFLKFHLGPFKKVLPEQCPFCAKKFTKLDYCVTDAISRNKFGIYFCLFCQIGFTKPIPEDMSKYYPASYYPAIKSKIYHAFQFRRPNIINKYKKRGRILDIGCGDGRLAGQLPHHSYVGIEAPFCKINNPNIKLVGIKGMKESASSYDLVTFWESLEHVNEPIMALAKSYRALKKNGIVIIECPDYSTNEKFLFGSRWFHLDPPRHLTHFTPRGIKKILESKRFQVIEQKQLYAPEYTPFGLTQSILYMISPHLNLMACWRKNFFLGFTMTLTILVLMIITVPASIMLYFVRASPILLTVAKKK